MGCAASSIPGDKSAPAKPPGGLSTSKAAGEGKDKNGSGNRSWADESHHGSNAEHGAKNHVNRAISHLNRAKSQARTTASFSGRGAPSPVEHFEPRRIHPDFHDPKYASLLQRANIKDAYHIDFTVEDRGDLGLFRLMECNISGEAYTCRTVTKQHLEGPEELSMLQAEVEAMHHLAGYPGIIGLHALYEDDEAFHLVLDHCPGGDLFDRVMEQGVLAEADAALIISQVLNTVSHLHKEKGLMHRDISLENIFLMEAPPLKSKGRVSADGVLIVRKQAYKVKVGGFASCAFFKPGQKFNDIVGSSYYIGPEVLSRSHGCEADIWSVGVLLYMMLCGRPPFSGDDEMEIFTSVMSTTPDFTGPLWASVSPEAIDVAQQMLNFEPDLRTSPERLLQHPWIKQHCTLPPPPPPLVEAPSELAIIELP